MIKSFGVKLLEYNDRITWLEETTLKRGSSV